MPQLAAKAARTLQQTSAGQDAAADAGAQRHTDDIGIALSRTGPDLAQQHTVGVVGDGDGQAEGTLQRTFNVHADPPREIAAGPATTPRRLSIWPVADTAMPSSLGASAVRNSWMAACTVSRIGVL